MALEGEKNNNKQLFLCEAAGQTAGSQLSFLLTLNLRNLLKLTWPKIPHVYYQTVLSMIIGQITKK